VVRPTGRLSLVLCLASFLAVFWPVLAALVRDWAHDDNYSHGFFIIPIAAYFAWERRAAMAQANQPTNAGMLVVLTGLAMLVAGLLGAELFLTRLAVVVTLAGALLYLRGWKALRLAGFPIAFLLLMIPIPAIIFNQIAFPLQLLASRFGETVLWTLGIPVLREGNIIALASTRLEVAEACSGIRSLISLLTLGIVYGYFTDSRPSVRAAIALSTIPIAILANGARVAGTGIAAHHFGPDAAQGFFHSFSGWLVFVVAFALVFVVTRLLLKMLPVPVPSVPVAVN